MSPPWKLPFMEASMGLGGDGSKSLEDSFSFVEGNKEDFCGGKKIKMSPLPEVKGQQSWH